MMDRSGCCPDPKIHLVGAEDLLVMHKVSRSKTLGI